MQRLMRAAVIGILGCLAAAMGSAADDKPGPAAPGKRFITMAAVEMKGGATVDKEPFPGQALPEGAGYVLKKPDASGRWEVSTYRFMPSQILVNRGDEVTLEMVGINGDEHPTVIEGYAVTLIVKRGQVSRVTFKADKAGVFPIVCGKHHPAMRGELIVL